MCVQDWCGDLNDAGGKAAEVAWTAFSQCLVSERIRPVGVAELKCIWPLGLRVLANRVFLAVLRCVFPPPLSL